jgi:long-chain fatty acid transport protein
MKRHATLLTSVCALAALPAFGNGFYVPVQAPEATGKGNAWMATADTAAAVYYNAAGLTQIDAPEVTVGAYAIILGLEADLDSGAHEKADNGWAVLPQIYAAVPVNEKLVAGFGINTPFGLATDWDEDSQFRYLATETELTYATGWAVLGYELTDTLSIGGGFGVHHADLNIGQVVNVGGFDFPSEFNGDSEALSWTLSTRWQPHEQHAFGLVYRSKADFNLKGDFHINNILDNSASLDFITPATLAGGYSYRPCREWNFEANIEWVNWDEFNTLNLSQGGITTPVAYNWESNFIYSVGATRHFDNGWNVSAGYNYIENSMPDATFTPGVADATRHWLNAGVGYQSGSFRTNFAYQYAFSDRDVSGSPFGLADGEFESRFHALMLNFDWRF